MTMQRTVVPRLVELTCVMLFSLALTAPLASGQQPQQPAARQPPPNLLLGMRVEAVRQRIPVAPLVLVVGSQDELVRAFALWSLEARFPILIDDGSDLAREDIARFVRAFEPEKIIRWSSDPADEAPTDLDGAINQAMRAAWSVAADQTLKDAWTDRGFRPPGVIVSHAEDPAAAAAAVLAVGRGQPIAWLAETLPERQAIANPSHIDTLHRLVERAASPYDLRFASLGDDIDAITIAARAPHRLREAASEDLLALTDRVGRDAQANRWAWASQIVADTPAEAANDAMAALFLQPTSATAFDGYTFPANHPFRLEALSRTLDQTPLTKLITAGKADRWRTLNRRPWQGGFIHINTSGLAFDFELQTGASAANTADDIPTLLTPGAVHFVHSFSASRLQDDRSIARRWLDAGAFVYLGSVDEPFLNAFVPPDPLARRLLAGIPWAAATRIDDAPVWKLATIGDPLWTMTLAEPPAAPIPAIEGSLDLESALREALTAGDLTQGIRLLVVLHRDEDATQIAAAALEEGALTPAAAQQAFHAAKRRSEHELVAKLFAMMPPDAQAHPHHRAILWQSAEVLLRGRPDPSLLGTLQQHPPAAGLARAATILRPHLTQSLGDAAVRTWINSLLDRAPDNRARNRLQSLLN